ncbi:MAG: hypothetical protein COB36_06025 [Alphaproteobacteria bacterium]|nr:MAG: hypothetical protein COB36_06025 [Alphaproteobacteria bacterium]
MRFVSLVSYVFMMMFVSLPSHAQYMTGLEIEKFFRKSEELYTQTNPNMDEIIKFTIRHTVKDAIIRQETKSNKGARIIKEVLTREEILANMKKTSGEIFDSKLSRTITGIEYSEDKISAKVEYTSFLIATVELSEEAKKQKEYLGMTVLPFKSLSVCSEEFKLVDDVLKILETDCKTEILYGKARAIR